MPIADVTVRFDALPSAYVTATGGTRRERGAAIAAVVRGKGWGDRLYVSYSETYGFLTQTEIRYRTTHPAACPCGEPTRWATGGEPALYGRGGPLSGRAASAHLDGEPLCPVMGPNGYVAADHPDISDQALADQAAEHATV